MVIKRVTYEQYVDLLSMGFPVYSLYDTDVKPELHLTPDMCIEAEIEWHEDFKKDLDAGKENTDKWVWYALVDEENND